MAVLIEIATGVLLAIVLIGSISYRNLISQRQQCPYCLEYFYISDCKVVFSDKFPTRPIPPNRLPPRGGLLFLWKRFIRPELATGPLFQTGQACRECPSCRHLVPSNLERPRDNIMIAVIGQNGSGVSTYHAALFQQLQERWAKNNPALRVEYLNEDVKEKAFNDYIDLLFQGEHLLTATVMGQRYDPIIFECTVPAAPGRRAKKFNLLFYDVAGEDYATQEAVRGYGRHIFWANALIVLVDPLGIPEINKRLPADLLYPSGVLAYLEGKGGYRWLTQTIIPPLERFYRSRAKAYFRSTPLAVVLSKSDLLSRMNAPLVPLNLCLFQSPPYLNVEDTKGVDEEIRALLEATSERPLLQWVRPFKKTRFFAVSSLGNPSDMQRGLLPSVIKPRRCLDPVLWALHELKLIPAGPLK